MAVGRLEFDVHGVSQAAHGRYKSCIGKEQTTSADTETTTDVTLSQIGRFGRSWLKRVFGALRKADYSLVERL
jgi:hypothetical protein